jgi:hypothetical protein
MRIKVENISALHRELIGKKYRFARPRLEETPWQRREITVADPFGNRLHFYEEMPVREDRAKSAD